MNSVGEGRRGAGRGKRYLVKIFFFKSTIMQLLPRTVPAKNERLNNIYSILSDFNTYMLMA